MEMIMTKHVKIDNPKSDRLKHRATPHSEPMSGPLNPTTWGSNPNYTAHQHWMYFKHW